MTETKDYSFMNMAYSLAEKAKGFASPNPYVGTVIAKKDVIVGSGFHEGPGKPHAEVIALQKAGTLAKNSTAYITLEPCIHWGRTPPCAENIIQSGFKRVVISALDPNPLVYKKGVKQIKDAGIEVSLGLLKDKNEILNEFYIKYITKKIPFVTLKAAVSLDGKIATKKLFSKWISSSDTREYIHLLRGEFDAIMIGINTLLKDDPLLTVRHQNWKGKHIKRIILDSHLRFPLNAKMLTTKNKGEILVFTSEKASEKKANALRAKGVEVFPVSTKQSHLNLKKILVFLGEREISSVLVEGGGLLFTSMIEEKLADKVLLTISPRLIGGEKAPSLFQGKGVDLVKHSICLKKTSYFEINKDIIVEGYI